MARTVHFVRGAIALLLCALACACASPLKLGEPSSRSLEQGVEDSLSATSSFEVTGQYTENGTRWTIVALQLTRSGLLHIVFHGAVGDQLEAIVAGGQTYFRGQGFLADHLGSDQLSKSLVAAAGSSWWKSSTIGLPRLPDLFDGAAFRSAFLGSAVSTRSDHVAMDGVDTVELSGPRADVYVAEVSPHRLVRLHARPGVIADGAGQADLHFSAYDQNFDIAAPAPVDVIDFSNLSTLPPIYTVVSVDTSRCASPCTVSAQLKNLGGATGAQAPSTITFVLTDAASGSTLSRCTAEVSPDVGYNQTTAVTCAMPEGGVGPKNAAIVTATPTNPGRA